MSFNREKYADLHESLESLRWKDVDFASCRACGATMPKDDLDEDRLCAECAAQVRFLVAISEGTGR